MFEIGDSQVEQFRAQGFVLLENLISQDDVDHARQSFGRLFRGEFETGVQPDEVNWLDQKSPPELPRQICNSWKADKAIAKIVLSENLGRAIAKLAGWPGARIMHDNVIWKPPGARPLGYHQDNAYIPWVRPREMVSCWIALDDTTAEGGTLEVVSGSHQWPVENPRGEFHGPENYREEMMRAANKEGVEPDIVPVVVPSGGGSFHHGSVWHGSGFNKSQNPRRSIVIHALSSEAEFVKEKLSIGNGPIYGRYIQLADNKMNEDFFPILWSRGGRRTAGLAAYLGDDVGPAN